MYAITGASGQLGRLVVDALLEKCDASRIVALVRDPGKLSDLAIRGVKVRPFDYDAPATLVPALKGVDRLLLISSNDLTARQAQHQAVIEAAKTADVGYIVYTSILHSDINPMKLAATHVATETAIKASGLAHAILRNGWYTENYAMSAATAIGHGVLLGSAGDGRISGASRADYAAAAATVLADRSVETRMFELAGDEAFTLTQFATAIADVAHKPVIYKNLPEADYRQLLEGAGLPTPIAAMLAESDAKAADDALFDESHALSKLLGRPTTPWRETLQTLLRT